MGSAEAGAGAPAVRAAEDESLRRAFRRLTTRGRSFLAAGAAATVCAYVLGQTDLLRAGVLLAALPPACVLVQHRTRHRLTVSRVLAPERVPPGTEARVTLRTGNGARTPAGPLRLEDGVPEVLGPPPRFVLPRMEPGAVREVSYRVRSGARGRYPLGPLRLMRSDPFGMCELVRELGAPATLTVVPRTEELLPGPFSGGADGRGSGSRHSLALAGDDDVIPRAYRHGDDLRRVHWRATARRGELMVRREERPEATRCTLLLDTRRTSHPDPDEPFEWAVSGAASAAVHLLQQGCAVRLLTDGGDAVPHLGGDDGGVRADRVLDALAAVVPSAGADLAAAGEALGDGPEGLLLAFLGAAPDAATVRELGRLRPPGHAAVAFLALPSGAGEPGTADALREAGWTVLAGGPGRPLPALWQEAGERAGKGAAR